MVFERVFQGRLITRRMALFAYLQRIQLYHFRHQKNRRKLRYVLEQMIAISFIVSVRGKMSK
ncbi:hypothetical protein BRO06_05725 [Xanthomonas oryzae pv. oryzae]|nr:hypothetical protein BRN54_17810 [Xanthomonas oryzae pv. oryzae]RBJ52410.1 hypothetical protein BRO06_05725 [Xanthomonas oryzae pv. oryzae]